MNSARPAEQRSSATDGPATQKVLRLKARPHGVPDPACWSLHTEKVIAPAPGQVLVRVDYLSIDPGMRNWISEAGSYVDPVPLGAVMPGFGIGTVIDANDGPIPPGTVVTGKLGVQEYAAIATNGLEVLPDIAVPSPRYLGALGISGITAFFGILDIAKPAPGTTVVVSGAAGSVGSIAGQLAKMIGCRVIGIAGGADKCRWLTDELGFDGAIDYKTQDVGEALDTFCPEGLDVFFDNVGGDQLDAALSRLRVGACVVLCGNVSQYNEETWTALHNYRALLVKRARMQGFLVFDYAARYPDARRQLADWLGAGKLIAAEDIVAGGVAAFPEALAGLFSGENIGKRVLQISHGI